MLNLGFGSIFFVLYFLVPNPNVRFWPKDAPIPDGSVGIPQSVGHWEALHGKIQE